MNAYLGRAADRLVPNGLAKLLRRVVSRSRAELSQLLVWRRIRRALHALGSALAAFEPRAGHRHRALRELAIDAAQLSRARHRDQHFFVGALALASQAQASFRPSGLQSYAEVSVRTAVIRALANYVASFGSIGSAEEILTSLAGYAPTDRAILLAHAELLFDGERPQEAAHLVRRALRINAVCQTAQRLLPRAGKGEYDLSDKFCPMPFTHLSSSYKADAFACTCSAWQPYPIGNVVEAASADEVWNSEAAQEIRRSIHDGDFSYCSRTLCSYIAARSLPTKGEVEDPLLRRYLDERTTVVTEGPDMVQMNHDPSCNLACPSCRSSVITAGPKEQRIYLDAAERVLLPLLKNIDGQAYISGGGESFASSHYKKILRSLNRRDYPGLFIYLITNGQLLTAKRWAEFPDLPEMIGVLAVSVDAARAETYEDLRRPGKWHVLMENLEGMARMRAKNKIRVFQINFVVQSANFREIPEFIALGGRLGVDNIWLQRLTNYGAYEEAVFEEAEVTSPSHPDHDELLGILRPYVGNPGIDMSMLLPLLPEVVNVQESNAHLRNRWRPSQVGWEPGKTLESTDSSARPSPTALNG